MKPTKVNYTGIKEKMKFGNQELPILTNHYHYYGREQMNDKFNVLVDHIWNIPKTTDHNENFVVTIKGVSFVSFTISAMQTIKEFPSLQKPLLRVKAILISLC